MKSTNTKGFTLVELIIVITILAILATIAFISFQGYTKDARNSKRDSDINSISRSIEVKMANAISPLSFVDTTTAGVIDRAQTINTAGIAGTGASDAANADLYYATDKINFDVLGAKAADFADPKGGSYLIGASTLAGGVYEIVTENYETDAGTGVKLVGNFKQRLDTNTATVTSTGTDLTMVIADGLGIFKTGDTTNFGVIAGISNDLTKITFNTTGNNFTTATSPLKLYMSEVKTLIGGTSLGY